MNELFYFISFINNYEYKCCCFCIWSSRSYFRLGSSYSYDEYSLIFCSFVLWLIFYILCKVIMNVLNSLSSTWQYFNQVLSLSTTWEPWFTVVNWSSLVSLLMSVLTNPFFYWIIGIIVIMSILPTFDDD